MSDNLIHKATIEAIEEVASNLRPEDYKEVLEGWGYEPSLVLPLEASEGYTVSFEVPDGRIAGLAGIQDGGRIWMLCTNAIDDFPVTFIRESKRFIESRTEPILWNVVDKRNKLHLKLLQHLGFKFLREVPWGPNQLTFIEFCRVWTSSPNTNGSRNSSISNRRPSIATSRS